jgi:hypothetical protein
MQYSDGVLRKGKRLFSLPYLSISLFVESKNNLYSSSFAFFAALSFLFQGIPKLPCTDCLWTLLPSDFGS